MNKKIILTEAADHRQKILEAHRRLELKHANEHECAMAKKMLGNQVERQIVMEALRE
ncbi:MAG TPA: hypothetical protein VFX17_03690 [Patescibacteria group bacterium]|nr:hypothetical protein [Patescibacteria group bacterium]